MQLNNKVVPRSVSISLVILSTLAVAYTLHFLSAVFMPIIVALLFAAFLEPIIHKMVVIKIPRIIAIIIAVSTSILLIALLLLVIIASLTEFFKYLAQITPQITIVLTEFFDSTFFDYFNIDETIFKEFFSIATLLNRFVNELSSAILNFTNSGLNFFSSVFMITLFTIFFLLELHDFSSIISKVMGIQSAHKFTDLGKEISTTIGRYLYIKTIVSIMTGASIFTIASLTGLKFAMMWGLLGFSLNFIPVIGSAIVVVGSILAAILQFYGSPLPLLVNLITMPLIQIIFGNIIDPRMQGKSLDLSPSLVLISLAIWGTIWGVPGMFLSVPVTVLIKIILYKFESTRYLAQLMGLNRVDLLKYTETASPT